MGIKRYRHEAQDYGDRYSQYRSVLVRDDKHGTVVKFSDHAAEVSELVEALEMIVSVASGETQVATGDTEGMAWIDKYARVALAKVRQ